MALHMLSEPSHRSPRFFKSFVTIGAILLSVSISMVFLHQPAGASSEAEARAFANYFCPLNPNPEQRLADFMWATDTDGDLNVSALAGQTTVPIRIQFFVTYCMYWGNWNDGATAFQIYDDDATKRQRLVSGPGSIAYGGTAVWGARSTWRAPSYAATLNISGWAPGPHKVCTAFTTTSNKPGAIFSSSPSSCFTINLSITPQWSVTQKEAYAIRTTPGPVKRGTTITDAVPGERYEFRYRWGNDGPNATARVNVLREYTYPAASQAMTLFTSAINVPNGGNVYNGTAGNTGTILASDAGQSYCLRTAVQPRAWNNAGRNTGTQLCVRVPYNYNLTPSVVGPNGMGMVGSPIPNVTPRVNNQVTGGASVTTQSAPSEWQLKRIEVPPGGTIPAAQAENSALPCVHYRLTNTCIDKGSGTRTFPAGSTTLSLLTGETIAPTTPVGTRICYTLSVRPYTQTSPNWRHSAPVCVTVSKLPKVQVWGHDVRTRGGIETGTTIINSGGNKVFGSWVEYGGFSVGANSGFGSGSGLNEGNTNTSASDMWNRLTFANVNNSGSSDYGRYTLPAGLPTITGQFIGAPTGGAFNSNLGAMPSGTYATGNVTINTSDVGQESGVGKSIIIVSTGTVTINGNIVYRGPGAGDSFTNVRQLPQVIIIARNINITNATTQVDAWLLTTGNGAVNTCSDRPLTAALNSTVCNAKLTVNGPVATQHLYLRRTAGSDTIVDAAGAAEVFNLRPDTYLWAYSRASQAGKAQTVYSVELPPRF